MKKIKEEELLLIKKQQENLDTIVKNIGISPDKITIDLVQYLVLG